MDCLPPRRLRIEGPMLLNPTDISFLRTQLSEVERQAQSLENQIDELNRTYQAQISELMRQKDSMPVEVSSIQNLLAPVRRIPTEILSEIFILSCAPETSPVDCYHPIIHNTSTLSSVCTAWRICAHSTPRLWPSFCFSLDSITNRVPPPAWVERWLGRSAALPLDIFLDFLVEGLKLDTTTDAVTQFMSCVFLNSSHRIRSLHLWISWSSLCSAMIYSDCSHSPLLTRLCLTVEADENSAVLGIKNRLTTFSGPNLQDVTIEESGSSFSILEQIVLPASQLTTLNLDPGLLSAASLAAYVEFLRQCHCLTTLTVTSRPFSGLDLPHPILLPALKSLSIGTSESDDANPLSCFVAPLLDNLNIRYYTQFEDNDNVLAQAIEQFQTQSLTSLLTLTVSHRYFGADSIDLPGPVVTALLSTFPTVKSFRIHSDANFNTLFEALTYMEDRPVLLPKLTELKVFSWKYPPALVPMLRSRYIPEQLDEMLGLPQMSRLEKVVLSGDCFKERMDDICLTGVVVDYLPNWNDSL